MLRLSLGQALAHGRFDLLSNLPCAGRVVIALYAMAAFGLKLPTLFPRRLMIVAKHVPAFAHALFRAAARSRSAALPAAAARAASGLPLKASAATRRPPLDCR